MSLCSLVGFEEVRRGRGSRSVGGRRVVVGERKAVVAVAVEGVHRLGGAGVDCKVVVVVGEAGTSAAGADIVAGAVVGKGVATWRIRAGPHNLAEL